jgi:hypothetical protein
VIDMGLCRIRLGRCKMNLIHTHLPIHWRIIRCSPVLSFNFEGLIRKIM